MPRIPTNFFNQDRQRALEAILGEIPPHEFTFLNMIGEWSAQKLWPAYLEINNPDSGRDMARSRSAYNGHLAFRQAIEPFIDPHVLGFRGSFLPQEAFSFMEERERIGGISRPSYIAALEMIAQGSPAVALSLSIDGSTLYTLWNIGDDAQKQRYVVESLANKKMLAFAQTEPRGGTDVANTQTYAKLSDSSYELNGQKNWITNGDWAEYYFTVLRTNPDKSLGKRGLSILMVHRSEIPEIVQMDKYTVPGSYTAVLYLDGAKVPVEVNGVRRMIGSQDGGFDLTNKLLIGGRVDLASLGNGISQEAFYDAVQYANERIVNGNRVIDFQAKRHELAELESHLKVNRYATYAAARSMQDGKLDDREAAAVKLRATELARSMTLANIDIQASHGVEINSRAVPYFLDTLVLTIGEGTSDVQRAIIAKNYKFP